MKFYLLSHSSDKNETGDYPQAVYPSDRRYYESPFSRSGEDLTNDYFPDVVPVLDFELAKKGKVTDILSVSSITAHGLLMNEKAKSIIEVFNIMKYKFYKGSLLAKGKSYAYYWLHIINSSFDGIDFNESVFCEADLSGEKIKEVKVNSFDDYIHKNSLCEGMNSIIIEKIKFTRDTDNFDLLFFPYIHFNLIASERLISELIENKISGFKHTEAFSI